MQGIAVLLLLLAATTTTWCQAWTPATTTNGSTNIFTSIPFPTHIFSTAAEMRDYTYFKELGERVNYEYCGKVQTDMENANMTCDAFCNMTIVNLTPLHLNTMNFCYFCATAKRSVQQVEQFRSNCMVNHPFFAKHLDAKVCTGSSGAGIAMIFPKLVNLWETPNRTAIHLCYCPSLDRYGYACDAYTAFFVFYYYSVEPYILLGLSIILFLLVLFLVTIPTVVKVLNLHRTNILDNRFANWQERITRVYFQSWFKVVCGLFWQQRSWLPIW